MTVISKSKAQCCVSTILTLAIGSSWTTMASDVAPQVEIPLTIQVNSEATVSGERVSFSDVGTCEGYDDYCRESPFIDLGPAPMPGETRFITQNDITEIFKLEFPNAKLTIEGSNSIQVTAAYQTITAEEIKQAFLKQATELLQTKGELKVEVESMRLLKDIRIRPGPYIVRFPLLETTLSTSLSWLLRTLRGTAKLTGTVLPPSETDPQSFSAFARIEISKKLPVAKRDLFRGAQIDSDDFASVWVKLQRVGVAYIEDVDSWQDYVIKRRVRAGEPLSHNQITLPRVIRRGQVVTMLTERAGIKVKSQVRTLGNGASGDEIDVEQVDTRKRMRAEIINSAEVRAKL